MIAENILTQLPDKYGHLRRLVLFVIDKSRDVSDAGRMLLFIPGKIRIIKCMKTTVEYIFKEVENAVQKNNLQWKNLKCITTDGGNNMCGKYQDDVALVSEAVEIDGGLKPFIKLFCGKCLDMSEVLKSCQLLIYIRSNVLNQFREFIEEIGQSSNTVFELCRIIGIFLNKRNRPLTELQTNEW